MKAPRVDPIQVVSFQESLRDAFETMSHNMNESIKDVFESIHDELQELHERTDGLDDKIEQIKRDKWEESNGI